MRGRSVGAWNVRYILMMRRSKPLLSLRGSRIGLFMRLRCLRVSV